MALIVLPNKHKQIAKINIGLCFPGWTTEQRQILLHDSLIETGKSIFEVGALWRWKTDKVLALVKKVHGVEFLNDALAHGHGVILASPHLGAWEIIGIYGSVMHDMTSLYRPPSIAALDPIMRESRQRSGAKLVPTDAGGVRALLKGLHQNHLITILPDQDPGDTGNVFAPFYSMPTNTMTLVSRLANKTNARVLPCYAKRLEHGKGYEIFFKPALDNIADNDAVIAATALNQGVEQCINECPSQYQWIYKRFKKRADKKNIYENL
jgi:KDO2-lipid IV(A) lauroyltransferase